MVLVATFPDYKTVTVEVDPWNVTVAKEAFYEIGAVDVHEV